MSRLIAGAFLVSFAVLLASCEGRPADIGITHGPSDAPVIALTFDDGLNGETTREVASLLDRYDMHGSFFVVGQTLEEQGSLGRELLARGHVVANHSFDHARARPDDRTYDELTRAEGEFQRVLGMCPRYFRPPYGTETKHTKAAVREAGMRTILWDVEVADWSETDAGRLAANVLAEIRPGSIVLLHDGNEGQPGADRSVLLVALPALLDGLRERGLQSVGLDRLLGESAYLGEC